YRRALAQHEDQRHARPVGHRWAASRCRRRDRGADRCCSSAGRLHAAASDRFLHNQYGAAILAARYRQGFRSGGAGQYHPIRARAASVRAGENDFGPHHLCQGESRQAELRLVGHWDAAASSRRIVQIHGRRRHRARALSRGKFRPQRRVGGAVQMMFSIASTAQSQIAGDTVRGIGVTSLKPSPLVPGIPAIAQSGLPDFEVIGWNGFVVPNGTPHSIVTKLNAAILGALADADLRAKLSTAGYEAAASNSPEDFAKFIAADIRKWASLATRINIKPN